MNVTAKDYKPYWFELKEEAADGSKKLSGMDYLLLETVAKALNFTIKVTPIASWAEVRWWSLWLLERNRGNRGVENRREWVYFQK